MMIRFLPWEPPGDPRFLGLRLLLLGESHYEEEHWKDSDGLSPNHTRDIVGDWGAAPTGRQMFFANIYTLLTGQPWRLDASDHAGTWASVYFYNYVQRLVPGGARHRPTLEMWKCAEAPFLEVLERIRPDVILVLGEALWQNMPDGAGLLRTEPDALGKVYGYRLAGGGTVQAAHVYHPSSGRLRATATHQRLLRFLDGVRPTAPAVATMMS